MSKVIPKKVVTPSIVQCKDRRPFSSFLMFMLTVTVLAGTAWHFYEQLAHQGSGLAEQANARAKNFERQLTEKTKELDELKGELARVKSQAEVQANASHDVQQQLVQLENERAEMQSELARLRSLVTDNNASLMIKGFSLHEESERHYRFTLNVVQVQSDEPVTKGVVEITILGKKNGKTSRLKAKDYSDSTEPITLDFKNFQKVTGTIRLPPGYEPEKLMVEITPENKKLKKYTEDFQWKATRAEDGKENEET